MIIYLYIKTHNKTGLKYLGKTTRSDYHSYTGSGVYWKRHLKIHGEDYKTEILLASESKEEIRDTGIFFSKLWNIVESSEWANLTEKDGNGGYNLSKLERTAEWKEKIRQSKIGELNPMFGKTGSKNPNYKGGVEAIRERKQKEKLLRLESKKKKEIKPKKKRSEYGMSGLTHKEETKHKISESLKGKPSGASGKIWITNGEIQKMIPKNSDIPSGYRKGKI